MSKSRTMYWDFFGPNAAGTARHFKHHLDEFLEKNGCTGRDTGLVSAGTGHEAVFCRVDAQFEQGVLTALCPRRVE